MKFQPGDRVSFINEKQEGTVVSIRSGNIVVVEIEDGFEIPVHESELVKTGIVLSENKTPQVETENKIISTGIDVMQIGAQHSVVIAAVPDATGAILTGPLTYYLINRTNFTLLFTIYIRRNKEWRGLNKGLLDPGTYFTLSQYKREDLIDVNSFLFQGLIYKEEELLQVSTIREEFGVLLPSLNNAKKELSGTVSFASMRILYSEQSEGDVPMEELLRKYETKKSSEPSVKNKPATSAFKSPGKYGILENEREIDLHIEELISDVSGLSNADMIQIQLRRFVKEMDYAITHHFKKLVLIHGVGNGKLKQEIRKELRNYSGVAFKDADSRKYGQGATEVTFQ